MSNYHKYSDITRGRPSHKQINIYDLKNMLFVRESPLFPEKPSLEILDLLSHVIDASHLTLLQKSRVFDRARRRRGGSGRTEGRGAPAEDGTA